jgi:hypothetical protein
MNKSLLVHGGLFVLALGWAYQTWTRDKTTTVERSQLTVWGGSPDDIVKLSMVSEGKDVKVERRPGDRGSYLWGVVTRTPPAPKPIPKATPDGGVEALSSPEATPPPPPQVREFPVGEDGTKLFAKLAPLRAVRDLGLYDEKLAADYGLAEAKDTVTIELKSGPRKLVVGGKVYGGNDRYVMDPDTKHVYVLAGDVLQSLETADSSLRERKLHGFKAEDVTRALVVIKGTAKERTLVRGKAAAPAAPATWADVATPDKPDQTLANFMDRVDKLSAMEFATQLGEAELTSVVSVEYQGKNGALGHLELFKKAAQADGKFDYYVKTELTRVLAKVPAGSAERVEQDLATL